jgi:hypothetical protein
MYQITDTQIDFILHDFYMRGIRIGDLQQNLLDHICILIEDNLEEGGDFDEYYRAIIPSFYRQDLYELEEETLFLLKHKRPFVLLTRGCFFLLLFAVLIGPIIGWTILTLGGPNQHNSPDMIIRAWEGGLVFALFPLLFLLVLFLTPDRFDPLIPRGSRILLGWRPFIEIIPHEASGI